MAHFELNNLWDVDKQADKLTESLFGSDKKRMRNQSKLFSPKTGKGSSAVIHDSDDEQYTKKGKRKLKKKKNKLKKHSLSTEDGGGSSSDLSHHLDHVNGVSPSQCPEDKAGGNDMKKIKKRKIGQNGLEEKDAKKRKVVEESIDYSLKKRSGKTNIVQVAKQQEAKEDEDQNDKKKRKRRRKNNPLKNKYRHLVLQAEENSDQREQDSRIVNQSVGIGGNNKHAKQMDVDGKKIESLPHLQTFSTSKMSKLDKSKPLEQSPKMSKREKAKKNGVHIKGESSLPDLNKESDTVENTCRKKANKILNPTRIDSGRSDLKCVKGKHKMDKTTPANPELKQRKHYDADGKKGQKKEPEGSTTLRKDVLKKLLDDCADGAIMAKKNAQNSHQIDKKKKGGQFKTGRDDSSETSAQSLGKSSQNTLPWGQGSGLAEQARVTLNSARFRYLNEQLYTCSGQKAKEMFQEDREAFQVYHHGYQGQVAKWEVNPLKVITRQLKDKPMSLTIADLGCGEAHLAQALPHKVHSFDLVALNKHVTACDMAKVPLASGSVDVAVFCLSLMGTNLSDYISEANRILKPGGLLKIAEVVSRFSGVSPFISAVCSHGFALLNKRDLSQMFYLMDYRKVKPVKRSPSMPSISLKPCVYKRR